MKYFLSIFLIGLLGTLHAQITIKTGLREEFTYDDSKLDFVSTELEIEFTYFEINLATNQLIRKRGDSIWEFSIWDHREYNNNTTVNLDVYGEDEQGYDFWILKEKKEIEVLYYINGLYKKTVYRILEYSEP